MNDQQSSVADCQAVVARFVAERRWESFHTPKNLVMAMAIEVAEVMEHFQWSTPEEASAVANDLQARAAVGEELADVFSYLLALAEVLQVDLAAALEAKMVKNAIKYPPPT